MTYNNWNLYKSTLIALLVMTALSTTAQTVQWSYTATDSLPNRPYGLNVLSDGNVYVNVQGRYKSPQYNRNLYSLALDSHGQEQHRTTIEECSSAAILYPFLSGECLAIGNNCNRGNLGSPNLFPESKQKPIGQPRIPNTPAQAVNDSRLYNKTGQLIRQADGLRSTIISSIRIDDAYHFFSNTAYRQPYATRTVVDKQLNVLHHKIKFRKLGKKKLSPVLSSEQPLKMKDDVFIYSVSYGRRTFHRASPSMACIQAIQHDTVCLFQYPDTLVSGLEIEQLFAYKNRVGLLIKEPNKVREFRFLDMTGRVIHRFPIVPSRGLPKDMVIRDNKLYILTTNKLTIYNLKGEELAMMDFKDFSEPNWLQMVVDYDKGVIISGQVMDNTVLVKVN